MVLHRLLARRASSMGVVVLAAATVLSTAGVAGAVSDDPAGQRATRSVVTASDETTSSLARPSAARGGAGARGTSEIDSARESRAVLDYWTPRRMRNAVPVEAPGAAGAGTARSVAAAPALEPSSRVSRPVGPPGAQDRTRAARAAFTGTAGKVFFTQNGTNYVCSGSAVNSSSKRLVATAAHCVHGGRGGTWHTNWMFEAGYQSGPVADQRGRFTAYRFRVFNEWIRYGRDDGRGFNSDVGFVTTNKNVTSRRRVVDAVGGMGLKTGGPYELGITLIGYPINRARGEEQKSCKGKTGKRKLGASSRYRFVSISGCRFGNGASGGPWLTAYNNRTGVGTLRTVSSFGPTDSNSYIAGPYFRSGVFDLFRAANRDFKG